ncbi:MAG: hypothetical protein GX288_07480 [Clostridiales bacterium]|nr:hypothetical protein [Clostridiales bacterium]
MANNIVAYVGHNHFDILIYLSRILLKLDKKVLVIDHSEDRSVLSFVPKPVGIDLDNEIITYLQVDFTAMKLNANILGDYDDILISLGFNQVYDDLTFCNRLVLVTDLYRFNHDRLRLFLEKYHRPAVPITLLLRNNMDTTLSLERIINYIDISIDKNEVFIIYRNDLDYINSLLCHYNSSYNFIRISRQLQKYLKAEIFHLYPQIKKSDIDTAYRIAKKEVK